MLSISMSFEHAIMMLTCDWPGKTGRNSFPIGTHFPAQSFSWNTAHVTYRSACLAQSFHTTGLEIWGLHLCKVCRIPMCQPVIRTATTACGFICLGIAWVAGSDLHTQQTGPHAMRSTRFCPICANQILPVSVVNCHKRFQNTQEFPRGIRREKFLKIELTIY